MTDADRDRIEGAVDKAKGTVKEEVGDLRDDQSQEAEGKMDKAKGAAKEKLGDAKDTVSDAVDNITNDR